MKKLLIVDGHNLLFQMFFGMPARIVNENGKAIHGTLGFVGALLRIIRMVSPTHAVVLFDGEHVNDRSRLDPGYKSNRPDFRQSSPADSPFSQLPDVYAALDYMEIPHAEITDYETDDTVASYVFSRASDTSIVIASFDSDFFQLISEQVHVLRYHGDRTQNCDVLYIKKKFGILPSQYADWKSLTGDTADHIPGVPKIGPKTATKLLNLYGDLDQLIAAAKESKMASPAVQNAILENIDRLKTNRQLIRLENRAALPFSLEQMRYTDRGTSTGEVLRKIGLK